MQRRSPPKHRHDGTSPLPLGMDWSPPPKKWNGLDTVWPHDPRSGWSYCVTIPSWVVLPKSRDSDPVVVLKLNDSPVFIYAQGGTLSSFKDAMIDSLGIIDDCQSSTIGSMWVIASMWFYRVQVGLQSPEGITTTRGVLRRFNDFLKLFTDLKKAFPKKNLPSTPPKGLLRVKTRALLEERRCSLEEWMTKLLSDIDISRSVAVASFLELEAAARSSFQDENQHTLEANSLQSPNNSSLPTIVGSSSISLDNGSDTAYETSEVGTPRLGRDDNSEIGMEDLSLDEDLTGRVEKLVKYGMSNIDEGLFMGQTILEQLEGLPKNKVHGRHIKNATGKNIYNGNASKSSFIAGNAMELLSESEHNKLIGHARKFSNESVGSDVSSLKGSEMSNYGIPNSSGDGSLDLLGVAEVSSSMESLGNSLLHTSGGAQVVIPLDQRPKMNRVLLTMQRRLVTAKTDMEDLIARLNQEIAVKDYLSTKVKDLEVELDTVQQKSKENLQQAILIERERFTQMQWDMEELRRKSFEMELKLKSKSEKEEKSCAESTMNSTFEEKDMLLQELDSSKDQLENLLKQYEELEAKSKADRKVLVKEVKSLRISQTKLELELDKSRKEKFEAEKFLQQAKQKSSQEETARKKLLNECKILHHRLQECNLSFPTEDEEKSILYSSSLADALDLLTTSDDQISLLLAEAELLAQDNGAAASDVDEGRDMVNDTITTDSELRKVLADIIVDNARLRKQVNSIIRHALQTDMSNKR